MEPVVVMEFSCECGRVLRADETHVGRRSTCPACGREVIVPDEDLPLTAPVPSVPVPPPAPVHTEVQAVPVSPAPSPPVAPVAGTSPVPPRPAPGKELLEKAKPGFGQALKYVQDTARFYSRNASAIWRRFSTSAEDPREIELLTEESYKSASFDETGWTVKLPACCVVCGQPTDHADTEQATAVEELSQPLWFPVGFAVAGLLISFWFWTIWPLLVLLPVGFLVGYKMRKQIEVRVTSRRCDEHALVRTVPRLRLVGENLYVGVGHKKVVELFAKKNTPEKVRPGPTASVPESGLGGGWETPPPKPTHAESMPLDDSPLPVETLPLEDQPRKPSPE